MFNKMAELWFSVVVLIFVHSVFANLCENESSLRCDECIRCGGHWCPMSKKNERCSFYLVEDFCDVQIEPLTTTQNEVSKPGKIVNPIYSESTLLLDQPASVQFTYISPVLQNVNISLVSSTQNTEVSFETDGSGQCNGTKCSVNIYVTAELGFCSENSTNFEYISLKIKVDNIKEEAIFKYHIPCACECSKNSIKKSGICYGHGDYSCGVCHCYEGWSGANCNNKDATKTPVPQTVEQMSPKCNKQGNYSSGYCKCYEGWFGANCENKEAKPTLNVEFERMSPKCNNHGDFSSGQCHCYKGWDGETCHEVKCEQKRGDVLCTHPSMSDVECLGNGYCGSCETCVCYHDKEGSQYFDSNNFCSDICMDTSGCETCLTSDKTGPCEQHQSNSQCAMTLLTYNETVAAETDRYNRMIWAGCQDTFILANNESCYVRYIAMKTDKGDINVMILESCHNTSNAGRVNEVDGGKVPLILGILFGVMAVAAVSGVMIWKYLSAVPQLPLNDSQYQNIDAEDCTGENPLYRPPTSQYKNPTYGKW